MRGVARLARSRFRGVRTAQDSLRLEYPRRNTLSRAPVIMLFLRDRKDVDIHA